MIVTSILIVFFIFKTEPLFRSVRQKLDRLNTILQENVAGVRLVKSFVRADFEAERFETANEAFTERSIRVMEFMATMSPALTMCVNIGMVIVIYVGGTAGDQRHFAGGADRGVHELSADDHDAVDHDDDVVQYVGRRHRRREAHRRRAGDRAGRSR